MKKKEKDANSVHLISCLSKWCIPFIFPGYVVKKIDKKTTFMKEKNPCISCKFKGEKSSIESHGSRLVFGAKVINDICSCFQSS